MMVKGLLTTSDLDYRLDDLDQIELLMACEEQYDLEILDEEIEKLKTPREFLTYVKKRLYAQKEQV
jgi:acyl carrier protein